MIGAAMLAALAVALWRPAPGLLLIARGLVVGPSRSFRPHPKPREVSLVLAPVALVTSLVLPRPSWVLCGLAGVVALGTASLVTLRTREAARADASRRRVVEAVGLLAAELRAGSVAASALASVAAEIDELTPVARAAAAGADVAEELRVAAHRPGRELLAEVAGAWQVADRGGAPLTTSLGRLADHGRDELDLSGEVAAELAPARATARVLAALPVLGLGLGAGAGADPVGVVLGTTIGAGCLLLGVVLASCGVLWIETLTRGAS